MFPIRSPKAGSHEYPSCEKQLQQGAISMIAGRMPRAEASIKLARGRPENSYTSRLLAKTAEDVNKTDSKRLKTEQLSTQRWENEGGQMIEYRDAILSGAFVRPTPMVARRHVTSLQWSARFVIERFQQGNGILREDMTGKGKHRE